MNSSSRTLTLYRFLSLVFTGIRIARGRDDEREIIFGAIAKNGWVDIVFPASFITIFLRLFPQELLSGFRSERKSSKDGVTDPWFSVVGCWVGFLGAVVLAGCSKGVPKLENSGLRFSEDFVSSSEAFCRWLYGEGCVFLEDN